MLQFIHSVFYASQQDGTSINRLYLLWAMIKRKRMFHLIVTLPTLVMACYYGFIASNIYISETQFIIRQPEKKSTSSLGQFLQSAGLTSSRDDTYVVRDYMLSRDALKSIDSNMNLRKAFSKSDIDFFSRFDPLKIDDSFEMFYKYYKDIITIDVDTASTICTLKTKAYSPQLAYSINEALLFLGEALVNQLNDRARKDIISVASQEVEAAEEASKAAALALSEYRNRQTLFDPSQQSSLQLQQVAKLQSDLIDVRGQLTQLRSFAAESPYIKALEKRAAELQREIQGEMSKVTGGVGSISQKMAAFERLTLERDYMDKRLATALASLQEAKVEANRQQLYLAKIVLPNTPDTALYPRRGANIVLTFLCCLLFYGIFRLLYAGVKEHQS
jgi:capsular polysaccharide transport system permease protein